jgi:hypothetical protein
VEPLAPVRRDDALALWREYAAGRTGSLPPEEEPPPAGTGWSAIRLVGRR